MLLQLHGQLTMNVLARSLALGVVLALLGGCAGWGGDTWQEPELHLVKVQTLKAKLHQQEFVLYVRVVNPNDSRLFIRNLDYSVRLEELLLVDDQASLWRSVAPHSQRTFQITARTNLWKQLRPLSRLLKRSQPLHYRLQVELDSGLFFWRQMHLMRSGEIIPGDLKPE
ncbi:LEA type 2 family protein [Pseudomonas fulva]|nr:LEA type 2 family protein [Pseudomonas fulva]